MDQDLHPRVAALLAAAPIGEGPARRLGAFQRPSGPMPTPDPEDVAAAQRAALAWLPRAFRSLSLDGPELARFVRGGQERVDAARRAFEEAACRGPRARLGHVVLRGTSGSGKSAISAAWLADRIRAGVPHRPRWVPAVKLELVRPMGEGKEIAWADLAISASELVIDDLGAEMYGAPKDGGIAAQRAKVASRVFHARYDRARTNVITTAHAREVLAGMGYGDGVARRVYDGAATVELGGGA